MRGAAAACVLLLLVAGRAEAQLQGQVYASGFQSPVAFVQHPTDRTVQFVVQQTGRIRVVRNGTVLTTDFLNLTSSVRSGGERGLLGLAFAPDYASSGRFFVNFTNEDGDTVVARFTRSSNPLVADPSSRFDLQLEGRGASSRSRLTTTTADIWRSGPMAISTSASATADRATTPTTARRIRASCSARCSASTSTSATRDAFGYRVPPNNPFLGGDNVRDEIWAFGLRNPWRYTFDDVARGGTGALVIGDVGQNNREEIDYEPRGAGGRNYGWRNFEGTRENVTSRPLFSSPTNPIFEYGRSDGVSITGGFVYRGARLGSAFRGRYFFADYSGRVWSLALTIDGSGEARASDRREHTAELGGSPVLGTISSFGVDADGELYLVNHGNGRIVRITAPLVTPPVPAGLKIIKP